MIVLDSINKSLEVILAGAITTRQLPFTVCWTDILNSDQSVSAVGSSDGTTNGASAVTMVAAPASGHTRLIKFISLPNTDTAAATATVQLNNNGTTRVIWKGALSVGDNLEYTA